MKVSFENGSVIKTTGFTLLRDNGEEIVGSIIDEITYVGGQETYNLSIELSSGNLTSEEEQELLTRYRNN
jgi:hypothetical protein